MLIYLLIVRYLLALGWSKMADESTMAPLSPRLRNCVSTDVAAILLSAHITSNYSGKPLRCYEAVAAMKELGIESSIAGQLFSSCSDVCGGLLSDVRRKGFSPSVGVLHEYMSHSQVGQPLSAVTLAVKEAPVKTEKPNLSVAAVARIWDILILAGKHSAFSSELQTLDFKSLISSRSHLMDQWVDLPLTSLRGYAAAFGRLCNWAPNRHHFGLAKIQMLPYFIYLQKGKPTDALGQWCSLAWLQSHSEIDLHSQDKLIKEAVAVRSPHVESQVLPMRLALSVLLEVLSSCKNQVVQGVSLFWLRILYGVPRLIHLQRIQLASLYENFLEGRPSWGKQRIWGKRKRLWSRLPRIGVLGQDVGGRMMSFYSSSGIAGHEFFLADAIPANGGLMVKSWSTKPCHNLRSEPSHTTC